LSDDERSEDEPGVTLPFEMGGLIGGVDLSLNPFGEFHVAKDRSDSPGAGGGSGKKKRGG
jgi:hypothetical protein